LGVDEGFAVRKAKAGARCKAQPGSVLMYNVQVVTSFLTEV